MAHPRHLHMFCLTAVLFVAAPLTAAQSRLFEVYSGGWDTCKRLNSSSACYRSREVYCRTVKEGKPVLWHYCLDRAMSKLATSEECDCVQDCVVSQWTALTSCGAGEKYSIQERTIVAPALRGGKPCPALREKKSCENTIETLNRRHTWRLGSWGECVPLQQNERECGHGLRSRAVDCINLQGRIVNQSLCLEEEAYRRLLPPHSTKLCEIPCSCRTSVWGPWSECVANRPCSQSGGIRRRPRTILAHPTLGERCEALEEVQNCSLQSVVCPITAWEISGWLECSVDGGALCGVGTKRRYVYCIEHDIDGLVRTVNLGICNSAEKPSAVASCEVPCNKTARCLQKAEVSNATECPNNFTQLTLGPCGEILLKQCVFSQWLPHSDSTGSCDRGTQVNVRRLIQPTRDCPAVNKNGLQFENVICSMPSCDYSWKEEEWSPCHVFPTPLSKLSQGPLIRDAQCGSGYRMKRVHCVDSTGQDAVEGNCHSQLRPVSVESCIVQCHSHCILTDWTDFSVCNSSNLMTRTRNIHPFIGSLDYLTNCPELESVLQIEIKNCPDLKETDLCPKLGCDEYFVERNQLDCSLESSVVCGIHQYFSLLCWKNKSYVNIEECVEAHRNGGIVHNAELLNRKYEICNVACPPTEECVFSNWRTWSQCLYMCNWPHYTLSEKNLTFRYMFRSRTLLSSWERSQVLCHKLQQEVRNCTPNKFNTIPSFHQCIPFNWTTSEWKDNTRDVWCDSNSTRVTDEACIKSLRPVRKRDGEGRKICDCIPNSECFGNFDTCSCVVGYERVGADCFPIEGCSSDLHCPLSGFQCIEGMCECADSDECEETLPPVVTDDGAKEDRNKTIVIILSSCVALLIIIIIIVIFLINMYRYRFTPGMMKKSSTIIHLEDQLIIEDNRKTVIELLPGNLNGKELDILDCKGCPMFCLDYTSAVTIRRCSHCEIILGPCQGSVSIQNCTNCTFVAAGQEFEVKDCTDCSLYMLSVSQPTIDSCRKMRFGCYQLYYPQLEDHFLCADMSVFSNQWSLIRDFSSQVREAEWSFVQETTPPISVPQDGELAGVDLTFDPSRSVVPLTCGMLGTTSEGEVCLVAIKGEQEAMEFVRKAQSQLEIVQTYSVDLTIYEATTYFGRNHELLELLKQGPCILFHLAGFNCLSVSHACLAGLPSLTNHVSATPDEAVREIAALNSFALAKYSM